MFLKDSLLRFVLVGAALIGGYRPAEAQSKAGVDGKEYPNQPSGKGAKPPAPAKRTIRPDVPLEVQARETAERAIPFVEKKGTAWIKERKCLACHYSGYMLWSLRDASQRGFAIDKDKLAESTNWAIRQPKDYGHEGAAQMLIARDRSDRSEKTIKRDREAARRDHQRPGQRRILETGRAASRPEAAA